MLSVRRLVRSSAARRDSSPYIDGRQDRAQGLVATKAVAIDDSCGKQIEAAVERAAVAEFCCGVRRRCVNISAR